MFPPRKKRNADFRVWNIQLVSYAGYKNEDGSIMGDPARVEFTEVLSSTVVTFKILTDLVVMHLLL